MKHSVGRTALILVLLMLSVAQASANPWRLAKDEEGIQVYLQDVEGSKYQAYRGVTVIKAPLEKLQAMQEDVAGACKWIHSCLTQVILKEERGSSWLYSQFETPWPVQSRDAIFQVTTKHEAGGAIVREFLGLPKYKSAESGFVRVTAAHGLWRLRPTEAGVEVTYQMHIEPGGSVPGWLANSFVVDAPFKTLQAWRQLAEQRQ